MAEVSPEVTILLVDDEPDIHRMLAIGLAKCGSWRLEHAYDGAQGLSAIRSLRPDLVLLDFTMPGMDGHEMLRTLRKESGAHDPPVILLSSMGMETKINAFMALGVVCYLTKPFKFEELVSEIRRALRRGRDGHA